MGIANYVDPARLTSGKPDLSLGIMSEDPFWGDQVKKGRIRIRIILHALSLFLVDGLKPSDAHILSKLLGDQLRDHGDSDRDNIALIALLWRWMVHRGLLHEAEPMAALASAMVQYSSSDVEWAYGLFTHGPSYDDVLTMLSFPNLGRDTETCGQHVVIAALMMTDVRRDEHGLMVYMVPSHGEPTPFQMLGCYFLHQEGLLIPELQRVMPSSSSTLASWHKFLMQSIKPSVCLGLKKSTPLREFQSYKSELQSHWHRNDKGPLAGMLIEHLPWNVKT